KDISMNWTILNVSIPVQDLDKSKQFYEMLLGSDHNSEILYQPLFDNEENIFFGRQGFGLRLFKPKPDLLVSNYVQSRRSYISILVENIDKIKINLDKDNINYIFKNANKQNSLKSLLVQEPSLNLIQFIENSSGVNENINGWDMDLDWGVHHMNLESLDVRKSIDFFCNVVGMTEGKWVAPVNKGDFSIDPSELAILPLSNNNRGLHVIKPDEGFGWRNNFAHNPSIGGHPAFTVKDLSALKKRLDNEDILYSDAKVYAMPGFHQIYLYDINANMLEVNQAV
ncbi:VOC family protein, partial [Alphaproteobacteria bacterium]|nr:VOC family protein [Alphaproteobacteria bacterium]